MTAPQALRLHAADDVVLRPCPDDRAQARRHVMAARTGDAAHEAHRRHILALVDAHPDVLHRSCEPAHLTGSAAVLDPVGHRFLLMLHAKLGRWLQPGGHADGDGALPGVALREAIEETGIEDLRVVTPAIDLDVHQVGSPQEPHLHLDLRYLVLAPADALPSGNHESLDLRWATFDELPSFDVDPGLLRMADAAMRAFGELRGQPHAGIG